MNNKFKYLLTALLGAALLVSGCGSDAGKTAKGISLWDHGLRPGYAERQHRSS